MNGMAETVTYSKIFAKKYVDKEISGIYTILVCVTVHVTIYKQEVKQNANI